MKLASIKRVVTIVLFCACVLTARAQDVDSVLYIIEMLKDSPESALFNLNQALIDNPDSEELLRVRADAYENLKQFDKAVEDYKALTVLLPDDETMWYLLGRNQFLNGELADAMRSLNRSTGLNPRFFPAFHTKTEILLHQNQYDAALRVSDSTLRIAVTAKTYFLQGEANRRLGLWQRAQWAFSEVVRIDKGYIEAHIALANIAANQNKPVEALEAAEAALAINPDMNEALIARSRGFALLNDFYNAIEDVSYVITLYPDNAEARFWRANYFSSTNRYAEAISDFEHVLRIEPNNWKAIAGRADAYANTGNKAVALEGYRNLLAIAENFNEKNAIILLANTQLFELQRENRPPALTLIEPESINFGITLEYDTRTITIRGIIQDESPIQSLTINGQNIPVIVVDEHFEFVALISLENLEEIKIEVSDVYDNTTVANYLLIRLAELSE